MMAGCAHTHLMIQYCRMQIPLYQPCMVPGCVLTHLMIDWEMGPTAAAIATETELRITRLGTSLAADVRLLAGLGAA